MKLVNNQLISKLLILILILVINACQNRDKCSVFCNVNEHPIHNKELNFYQDANEKPVKINNTYYVKYHLESKKYDTMSGYWGRESDTIFYINNIERMDKYPMLIICDSVEQRTTFCVGSLCFFPYYSVKIIKLEILNNDTIYIVEHETDKAYWRIEVNEDILSKVNIDSLEHKDFVEKRIYKLSINKGILDYKVEKGIVRRKSLPYKYSHKWI